MRTLFTYKDRFTVTASPAYLHPGAREPFELEISFARRNGELVDLQDVDPACLAQDLHLPRITGPMGAHAWWNLGQGTRSRDLIGSAALVGGQLGIGESRELDITLLRQMMAPARSEP